MDATQDSTGHKPAEAATDEVLTIDRINEVVASQFPGSGSRCVELGSDFVVARLQPGPDDIRPGGFISGPTQFALMDAAFWFAAFVGLGRIELMAMTSELSIRYLRPARGEMLYCKAQVESVSRRSIVATGHVWVDDRVDKITSTGQGSYAIPLPR